LPAPWPRRCRSCRMRRSNSPIAPSLISAASAPSRADGPGQSDRVSRSAGCRGLHACRTTEGSNVDRHTIGDQPARADQRIITGRKPFATPGRSVARARNLSGAGPSWPRCHRLQCADYRHSFPRPETRRFDRKQSFTAGREYSRSYVLSDKI
jgi:hypothetical protein